MFEIIIGALLFVGLFLVARKLFSKKERVVVAGPNSALDNWVAEQLGQLLATRLAEEPRDITATIGGSPDTDVVTKIESAVQRVELVYERAMDAPGSADLRLEVRFENGELDRVIKRIAWSMLPGDVSSEFAEGGASQLYREWQFSWQRR